MFTKVKTVAEIKSMRQSGRMLAHILEYLKPKVEPGIATSKLAELAGEELRKIGGKPAFLGYQSFPSVLCVSVNDEVVHGMPGGRVIQDGDIVSLDFGVNYRGMITDSAVSVIAGKAAPGDEELVKTTEKSMYAGIDTVKSGVHIGDIGAAVETVLSKAGYGIVRDLVGHGVGHALHEEPNIPNYGTRGQGTVLKKGMTIAIEPMATLGEEEVYTASDGWTVCTRDGSKAAHFEHTILITDSGAEILTSL